MKESNHNQITICFSPTTDELTEIYRWLEEEERLEKYAGFYCNWDSIIYSFERKEIAIISDMGSPVGFMSWILAEKTAKIQLAEIKPGHRQQGLGKKLTNTVLDHFRNHGIFAVKLHCQPQTSEQAWKKIGFKNFPEVEEMQFLNNEEEGRQLYQILVPHQEVTERADAHETLELWPVGSHMSDNIPSKWIFNIEYSPNGALAKPIIAPAKHKWNICWKKGSEVIKNDSIKYFSKSEIHFDIFLLITEFSQ